LTQFFSPDTIGIMRRGFTLIELLVVVAILGILIGVLVTIINPAGQIGKARDAQRKNDLHAMQSALDAYLNDTGHYPPGGSTEDTKCRILPAVDWGDPWPGYIGIVPKDPLSTQHYCYQPDSTNGPLSGYYLYAKFERTTDNQTITGLPYGYNYGVSSSNLSVVGPVSAPIATSTPTATPGSPAATSTPTPTPVCVNGYKDVDKDGYGAGAFGCYIPSPSYNIVNNNTDCYDGNANAHPGQTAYFTVDRGDGSFDYDCNGSNNYQYQSWIGSISGCNFSCRSIPATWTCGAIISNGIVCGGASGTFYTDANCSAGATSATTIACR